jgi:hypothetical protein
VGGQGWPRGFIGADTSIKEIGLLHAIAPRLGRVIVPDTSPPASRKLPQLTVHRLPA